MRKFSADWVYPVSSPPLPRAVVVTDEQGKILTIEPRESHDPSSVDIRPGILCPGFVNTHCHLELSHMKGKVDTGTGLIPFITGVVTQRNAAAELIQDAIERAEAEMLAGGIVAVGDISNVPDTFAVKSRGRPRWYTFVELFDFFAGGRRGKNLPRRPRRLRTTRSRARQRQNPGSARAVQREPPPV